MTSFSQPTQTFWQTEQLLDALQDWQGMFNSNSIQEPLLPKPEEFTKFLSLFSLPQLSTSREDTGFV